MKVFTDTRETRGSRPDSRFEKFRAFKYTFLFFAILAQFVLVPLLEKAARSLVPLAFILIVFAVLGTLDLVKWLLYFSLGLGTVATVTHYVGRGLYMGGASHSYFFALGIGLEILFLLIVVVVLVVRVFSEEEITGETIKGGISVYFLLGFLWAYVYAFILILDPGAIAFSASLSEISTITYFSFTTLTTLGYGDVTPVGWLARNLTILESSLGQIFLTVLIARLVGMHIASKSKAS